MTFSGLNLVNKKVLGSLACYEKNLPGQGESQALLLLPLTYFLQFIGASEAHSLSKMGWVMAPHVTVEQELTHFLTCARSLKVTYSWKISTFTLNLRHFQLSLKASLCLNPCESSPNPSFSVLDNSVLGSLPEMPDNRCCSMLSKFTNPWSSQAAWPAEGSCAWATSCLALGCPESCF